MVNLLALIFTIILSMAHFYGESIHLHKKSYRIISFGAGVMLSYLILVLFPKLFQGIGLLNNTLFLFILMGFSLLHLVEKYIYQHASKNKKLRELKEVHTISFFIYHFIVGIIVLEVTSKSSLDGFILFIPLLFHTTIGTISLKEIKHSSIEKGFLRVILSSSPVLGLLIASFFYIPQLINYSFLALVSGILLYIITREVIPKENKGDPIDFLLGISMYTILIVITWII